MMNLFVSYKLLFIYVFIFYFHLLMYVNVIFAKNMFKNHVDPICDALAQKVLIAHKLVFS